MRRARIGLGVVIVLTVGLAVRLLYPVQVRLGKPETAAASVELAWDQIELGTEDFRVQKLLGNAGRRIVERDGWPRCVGEILGSENGSLTFQSKPVFWRAWLVPGPRQWVAVCFVNDGSGGSLTSPTVLAKRSGPTERMPNELLE